MDAKPRKMTVEDYRVLNSCAEMVRRALLQQPLVLCISRCAQA